MNYLEAIDFTMKNKKYVTHYISYSDKEVVFELEKNECLVFDIQQGRFYSSNFVSEEDYDEIEYELNHLTFRERRIRRQNNISLESSYYIRGLAFNSVSYMLDYWQYPSSFRLLLKDINRWYKTYEKFEYWKKNKFEEKVFKNSIGYSRWKREGYLLFQKASKLSTSKYKISIYYIK